MNLPFSAVLAPEYGPILVSSHFQGLIPARRLIRVSVACQWPWGGATRKVFPIPPFRLVSSVVLLGHCGSDTSATGGFR